MVCGCCLGLFVGGWFWVSGRWGFGKGVVVMFDVWALLFVVWWCLVWVWVGCVGCWVSVRWGWGRGVWLVVVAGWVAVVPWVEFLGFV